MYLGYNTNGLAHHDLFDAVELLADLGYQGVAVTIDHHALDPRRKDRLDQIERLRRLLDDLHMRSVVETGARFLLDPRHKHEPTLVSADPDDRARRMRFYEYAIDCAAGLGSDCVSLWSGVLHEPIEYGKALHRLAEGLAELLDYADERGVALGFEPEPGMLVDSMARFEQLLGMIEAQRLRLTLDVGHLHCQGETPISQYVHLWASRLVNVHIEDMRAGTHEHLMFGEGEIDFPPVFEALRQIGYRGGVFVELSRHGHEGPEAAGRAIEFLRPMIETQ
ncbi:MAG TPA: sugar phosphate isomerase/epimerase [Planctomycetaceae bacterium]|nr:sugar phosphate isomerase/epimerase [Planctomycetaceae bacterium]